MWVEAVSDLSALGQFRNKKEVKAENGKEGRGQFRDGESGRDIVLKIPVGTVIHNMENQTDIELLAVGQKIEIAKGGIGGRGNFHFRSSTNTSPKQFQQGRPGEAYTIRFELKLIADVGLIGFPNAGKSTLLNILTNAKSKVANYPFTTLEPNLGVYYELILADIPGLIEGASSGKGLGMKFLRHIERTRVLFHCISCEIDNPVEAYKTITTELVQYKKIMARHPQYIILTKTDMVSPERVREKIAELKKTKKTIIPISAYDDTSLVELKKILNVLENEKIKGAQSATE